MAGRILEFNYGVARAAIALVLTVFLGLILVIDSITVDYMVDPVVTGSILGAIVAVVGVDLSKRVGGPPE